MADQPKSAPQGDGNAQAAGNSECQHPETATRSPRPAGTRRLPVRDRQDLRQGPVARESRRAAIVPDDRGAAGRDRPAHAWRAGGAGHLRMRTDDHGDGDRRAARRYSWSRRRRRDCSRSAACPRRTAAAGTGDPLSACCSRTRARPWRTTMRARVSRRCISRRSISKRSTSSKWRNCGSRSAPSPTDVAARCLPRRRDAALAARGGCSVALAASAVRCGRFRSTAEAATVLYDAPSAKARAALRLWPRRAGRSAGERRRLDEGARRLGTIGWIAGKVLAEKRTLIVRVPAADVRGRPTTRRRSCFAPNTTCCSNSRRTATSPATTATPGWVKVRHRDGQSGLRALAQVFGL